MNTKLALLTLAASLLPFAASAADEPAASAGYQLKNRSTFTAAEDARAPFWPIGWARRVQKAEPGIVAAPVVVKASLDASQFKITSILLGSPSLAVINGRAYGEGEYLKAPRVTAAAGAAPVAPAAPPPARVRVQQINDGSVVLQSAEESLTVQFNRPGLAAKQSVRELSFEDR